jgi:hypothetical protein
VCVGAVDCVGGTVSAVVGGLFAVPTISVEKSSK